MEFVSILWYYCWRLSTWDLLPKFRYTKSLDNIIHIFSGTFSLLSCWSAWPLWADQSTSATFCISSFKNSVQFVSQLTSSISFSLSRGNKMFKRFLKQQFIILLQLLQSEGAGKWSWSWAEQRQIPESQRLQEIHLITWLLSVKCEFKKPCDFMIHCHCQGIYINVPINVAKYWYYQLQVRTMYCEKGRAMIDYNHKSVSGQFIFSAVTPPSSQSQLSASVCPLSQMRPSNVWVQAQATAQCCQHCPISAQSESDTKYESCMKASRAHQPSASCLL